MSTVARTRIQLWIYGLAALVLTAGLASPSTAVAGAGAAAALLVVTTLLASNVAGAMIPRPEPVPIRVSRREHARRTVVLRQCDPDAAGRARPRAPGHFPLS